MTSPYCHPLFAEAHRHLGVPVAMSASGSYAYLRSLPDAAGLDASALYPIWVMQAPEQLATDFSALTNAGAISFVGVCALQSNAAMAALASQADVWQAFKPHYLFDNRLPFQFSKHHRYELKRANKSVSVHWSTLTPVLDKWLAMYGQLAVRHQLSALHQFPRAYFECLSQVPGLEVVIAATDNEPVSMHLWFDDGEILWSHLAASSEQGYALSAAYAVNAAALDRYGSTRLINFGGTAGIAGSESDGLARFKQGFSNRSETSWLFGKILDPQEYRRRTAELAPSRYFPRYRQPAATVKTETRTTT
ncbi:hypothetical protein HPT27_13570 [Permianibacter sp. IMCC34836]|uniref:hypothetical protein n=1 Tax=Permianibacter fluminis TaxID=2738515 RepID=UPI00155499C2|nr:hypothetical protein [Permianibacter fluminis]NQD38056.1 hypothetical protein [Permianibacter fluminis]